MLTAGLLIGFALCLIGVMLATWNIGRRLNVWAEVTLYTTFYILMVLGITFFHGINN